MTALHFATTLALSVVVLSSCATNTSDSELDLSLENELQLESLVEQQNIDTVETDVTGIEEIEALTAGEDIEELLAAQALETELLTQEEPVEEPSVTATPENTDPVIVEVTETFYRLKLNPETNVYDRTLITEARPGNLIELVVSAQNKSNIVVRDVELNNTVPSGPVTLLPESIATDTNNSIYRISRNGETFFPADAELEPSDIRFIQWVIIALQPEESIELKYRFTVNR